MPTNIYMEEELSEQDGEQWGNVTPMLKVSA